MPRDMTIVIQDRPGTLAAALQAVGGAGINIEGTCGFPSAGEGMLHILVQDGAAARRALESAGQVVRAERDVIVCPVEDKPGAAGALFRRIADAGVNVDLVYLTTRGQLVIGADDLEKAEHAAAMGM